MGYRFKSSYLQMHQWAICGFFKSFSSASSSVLAPRWYVAVGGRASSFTCRDGAVQYIEVQFSTVQYSGPHQGLKHIQVPWLVSLKCIHHSPNQSCVQEEQQAT
jgi:hypothetical protein